MPNNEDTDREQTVTADEQEKNLDGRDHKFQNFVQIYQTTPLFDYSKVEYTNKTI